MAKKENKNMINTNQSKHKALKDAFENRLTIQGDELIANSQACAECQEAMVFALMVGGEVVSIGLTTILNCLRVAEIEGYVPEIDPDRKFESSNWWLKVKNLYDAVDLRYEKV